MKPPTPHLHCEVLSGKPGSPAASELQISSYSKSSQETVWSNRFHVRYLGTLALVRAGPLNLMIHPPGPTLNHTDVGIEGRENYGLGVKSVPGA